jgi:hypothetical protein
MVGVKRMLRFLFSESRQPENTRKSLVIPWFCAACAVISLNLS